MVWYTCPIASGRERYNMNKLNVVIAALQLVGALLRDNADTSKGSQVASLLAQAQNDLAAAAQGIVGGQDPLGPQG